VLPLVIIVFIFQTIKSFYQKIVGTRREGGDGDRETREENRVKGDRDGIDHDGLTLKENKID
jgi:hypothetical protein